MVVSLLEDKKGLVQMISGILEKLEVLKRSENDT